MCGAYSVSGIVFVTGFSWILKDSGWFLNKSRWFLLVSGGFEWFQLETVCCIIRVSEGYFKAKHKKYPGSIASYVRFANFSTHFYFCAHFCLIMNWYVRYPVGNCTFKVNNRSSRTRCEICSKLTIKIPERRHWRRSGIFIINFEHISHLILVFLVLTLSR